MVDKNLNLSEGPFLLTVNGTVVLEGPMGTESPLAATPEGETAPEPSGEDTGE